MLFGANRLRARLQVAGFGIAVQLAQHPRIFVEEQGDRGMVFPEPPFPNGQRLLEQRAGVFVPVLRRGELGQPAQRGGDRGMRLAQVALPDGERTPEQRLGFLVSLLAGVHRGQIVQAVGDAVVVGPHHGFGDLERALQKSLRLGVFAQLAVQRGEIVEALRYPGMIGTVEFLADGERTFVIGLGFVALPLIVGQTGQVVEDHGDARIPVAELLGLLQGRAQVPFGFGVAALLVEAGAGFVGGLPGDVTHGVPSCGAAIRASGSA